MEQAFNSSLKPTQRLVMICLADNANNEGICFPSISTIAIKSGLSKRSVINNIQQLVEIGCLLKKYRSRRKGGRSSNKYLLFPNENTQFLSEEDYEIFEDLLTQSEGDAPPTQSEGDALAQQTQSEGDALESEPSLKAINRHLPLTPQNTNTEALEMWCEYKGKKYTQQAKNLAAKKLAKHSLSTQLEMVEDAIMNGWKGLFEPKQKQTQTHQKSSTKIALEKYYADKEKKHAGLN